MIPLSTLVKTNPEAGAELTVRYNLLRSVAPGQAAPGFSSGQAMKSDRGGRRRGPAARDGLRVHRPVLSKNRARSRAHLHHGRGAGVLLLAALYELVAAVERPSRSPFSAVLLGSMLGVAGQVRQQRVRKEIGLIMLIGLATAAKSAILIVEFLPRCCTNRASDLVTAATEAARLRFRPILMTAYSFILGVVPADAGHRVRRQLPPHDGRGRVLRHAGGQRYGHRRVSRTGLLRHRGEDGRTRKKKPAPPPPPTAPRHPQLRDAS
ncbi:MAG: efflux RND transporter permease subunit [Kiritimatiellia bacterium]